MAENKEETPEQKRLRIKRELDDQNAREPVSRPRVYVPDANPMKRENDIYKNDHPKKK